MTSKPFPQSWHPSFDYSFVYNQSSLNFFYYYFLNCYDENFMGFDGYVPLFEVIQEVFSFFLLFGHEIGERGKGKYHLKVGLCDL